MQVQVSIIVPVYNVERYLEKCLMSIENQTYSDYEVILVDDGSTDSSGNICNDYVNKHTNARVIHQKNMGLSGARNSGTSEAKGKYITFVDSDDVIANCYIEVLIKSLENYNADISVARSLQFWKDEDIKVHCAGHTKCLTAEEMLIEMCNGYNFGVSACCKMYKRELVLKYPYPLGKLYEDLATTYKIVGACTKAAFSSRYIYYYRQRDNSISHHNSLSEAQLYGLEAAKNQFEYIKSIFPKAADAAQARCILKAFEYIAFISTGSKDDIINFKKIQTYVKNHSKGILRSCSVNFPNKVRFISIFMGYRVTLYSSKIFDYIKRIRAKRERRK